MVEDLIRHRGDYGAGGPDLDAPNRECVKTTLLVSTHAAQAADLQDRTYMSYLTLHVKCNTGV